MVQVPDSFNVRIYRLGSAILVPLYLVWTHFMFGLRPEHFGIMGLVLVLFWQPNRKVAYFAFLVLPFLIVGLAYDNLRLFLPFRGTIHIDDLYLAERALFGVSTPTGRQILPEWFKAHPVTFFDFICGIAYFCYLVEIFLVGFILFFKDERVLRMFAWGWCLLNLLGMTTWILFPAAPPWYVDIHGLGPAVMDAAPSAAGAARFDELMGIDLFKTFYSRNTNVFGAMPSLHCGYPSLVAMVLWRYGWRWRVPTIAFAFLVCFSAVYLRHHYVLDVLAGIVYAGITFGIVVFVTRETKATNEGLSSAVIGDG